MKAVLLKTFGGLSKPYYIRHFLFGLIFPAMLYFVGSRGQASLPAMLIIFMIINTLLYPYSRYVYESIIEYIMGNNVFFTNAVAMLFVKFATMAFCWVLAIFVAPVGLAYLYFFHSKASTEE